MNKNIDALHTLSRRYCIDKIKEYKELMRKYQQLELTSGWTEELDKNYNLANSSKEILDSILIGIEGIDLKELKNITEVKEKILDINNNAIIKESCRSMLKSMDLNINKEKEKFNNFIKALKNEDLTNVQPLFYRRSLSSGETDKKFDTVVNICENLNSICLKSEDFKQILSVSDIIQVLSNHKVNRIYELCRSTRFHTSYEMDLCIFNPFDKYEDWYWCNDEMDWMIFSDHERYTHIYGKWLIEELGLISFIRNS